MNAELVSRLEQSLDPYNEALLQAGAKTREQVVQGAQMHERDVDLELLLRLSQQTEINMGIVKLELATTLDTTMEDLHIFLSKVKKVAGEYVRTIVVSIASPFDTWTRPNSIPEPGASYTFRDGPPAPKFDPKLFEDLPSRAKFVIGFEQFLSREEAMDRIIPPYGSLPEDVPLPDPKEVAAKLLADAQREAIKATNNLKKARKRVDAHLVETQAPERRINTTRTKK